MNALTVHKQLDVPAPPARAWEVFTARIGTWWPARTHSQAKDRVVDVVLDAREGGLLYEVADDGTTFEWGDVLVWDPPERLVISWRVSRERDEPTTVEVRFSATDTGTRVELEHSGWEIYADGDEASANYDAGWDVVLAAFAAAAS